MNLEQIAVKHQQALQGIFAPQPRAYTHVTRGGSFTYALTPGGQVLFRPEDVHAALQGEHTRSEGVGVLDNAPAAVRVCACGYGVDDDGRVGAYGTLLSVRMAGGRSVGRLIRTGLRERHWGYLRQQGGTFRSWKTLKDHPEFAPQGVTAEAYEALLRRARLQGRAMPVSQGEVTESGALWPSGERAVVQDAAEAVVEDAEESG